MIIETHAHYDDEKFDADRAGLLSALRESKIEKLINVGASFKGCEDSVKLAHEYDFIYAAVGVHPSDIEDLEAAPEERMNWLLETAKNDPKVVAVGEIGLDYYWDREEEVQKKQREWFKKQLEIARKADLPVIIHSRDAAQDTMEIMKEAKENGIRGVLHCYSYSPDQAREYVKMGYYIGVGGVVTFKNGKKLQQTVAETPLEHILLETDSPYLSPEPNRGKRNDSRNLHYIAEKIAKIKGITKEEVCERTKDNARVLFTKL